MSHSDEYSRTGPETCRAGISPCPQTQAATRQQQATNSSPTQSATRHRWMAGRGVGIRTAGRGVRIRRLIPVAITAALAFSVVLSGHASASQTGNARRSTERIAGMAQPKATHARLVLSPNAVVIEAGDRVQYRAEGYDDAGKYRGDVTPDTTFSVGKDVCKRAICTANPGTYTVTGTFYINDTAITGTAHLLVLPRPLASLKLRPNPAVIEAGGSRDYTAEGLDKAGRSLGDLTAYTRFSISPDGSCKNATCTPADPGRHTVTGTVDLGKRQVTGTADLLVLGPLARVTLQPNPATIFAGATVTYTARGEDANGNPRGDVTANTSFSISPDGSCAGATCIATKAGDHTVTATVDAGRRHVTAMAELHVVAGPLASLTLRPSPATIVAGAMVTYTARGEDANGNPRGDVTANTSVSISPDGSCAGATCTATKAGDHTVTATVDAGGRHVTATAELHVVAGPLASLTLRPSPATIVAGAMVTYTARGEDANGNPRGDVTANTSFSISP